LARVRDPATIIVATGMLLPVVEQELPRLVCYSRYRGVGGDAALALNYARIVHPKFASKNPEFNQLLGFDPNILTLPSLPVSRKLPVG
jgi:hypothetical protein